MTNELAVPSWLAVAALVALVVLVVAVWMLARSVRRSRSQTEELLATAAGDAEALRAELAGIQETLLHTAGDSTAPGRVPVATVDEREYVITELAQRSGPRVPARVVPAPLFADILLRESVIKTASLAAGLRRALSPEVRNRIRFEMRREVKRSRKERKLMLRQARRDWEARQRSGVEAPS